MQSPPTVKHKLSFLFFKIGIVCFLAACSPTVVTLPTSAPSSPTMSAHIFTSYDSTELPMKVWLPSDEIHGVVIAVHGFNDYSNFIKDSTLFFNTQKIAIYSYDQRGFGGTKTRGRWSGTKVLSNDLKAFVKLVSTAHPAIPIFILGDSMGGAVTIVTMAKEDPPQVAGVILVAPAVWARSEMVLFQRFLLWIAAHTIPWKKVTGESLKVKPSDNIDMLQELGKDPLVIKGTRIDVLYGVSNLMDEAYGSAELIRTNSLILYGEKDEIIPKKPIVDFYKRLPFSDQDQQQMILYDNGYHMLLRDLQAEIVIKDIGDWIKGQAELRLSPKQPGQPNDT